MLVLKSAEEIKLMQIAGAITASVFDAVEPYIKPGVSTYEIDQVAYATITAAGAKPSFLNYVVDPDIIPFPGTCCISVNDEVIHGIPSKERLLQDGDIVSVDVGAYINGYHGDACRTFLCGNVAPEIRDLVRVTEESFWKGLEKAYPGNRLGDISAAVQAHIEEHHYGIVREFTGHGLGRSLHEDPELPNYGRAGHGLRLCEGMVLALEPMVTLGSPAIGVLDDDWTIVTQDGKAAAHYENSFAITARGPLLLTCPSRAEEFLR